MFSSIIRVTARSITLCLLINLVNYCIFTFAILCLCGVVKRSNSNSPTSPYPSSLTKRKRQSIKISRGTRIREQSNASLNRQITNTTELRHLDEFLGNQVCVCVCVSLCQCWFCIILQSDLGHFIILECICLVCVILR